MATEKPSSPSPAPAPKPSAPTVRREERGRTLDEGPRRIDPIYKAPSPPPPPPKKG